MAQSKVKTEQLEQLLAQHIGDFETSIQDTAKVKTSVLAATVATIATAGTQTVDGIALIVGDRCLVKDQSTASENGIYIVASGSWTRATDSDTSDSFASGTQVFVETGTANAGQLWINSTPSPIVLDTTALTFAQSGGGGGFDETADPIIIGAGATGPLAGTIAIGASATANEDNNIAIGINSITGQTPSGAVEIDAIAIGVAAKAYETSSIAIGDGAESGLTGTSVNPNGIAIGKGTWCGRASGIAFGDGAWVDGISTIAIGDSANTSNQYATAIGFGTVANGDKSIAMGYNSTANATNAVSIGNDTDAFANSVAIGDFCKAGQNSGESGAVAIGFVANAYDTDSIAIGNSATAGASGLSASDYAIAIGGGTDATGAYSVALGYLAQATVDQTFVLGSSGFPLDMHTFGNIVLGTGALATTATDGFFYAASTPGTPTGTPTDYAGRVALTFDTVNNKLYFYNGVGSPIAGWVQVTLT